MDVVPLGQARDDLSHYVDEVETTHERVTITRHGRPAAILIAPEDLESLEETLDLLSTPGALDAIREGQADIDAGRVVDNEALKARYGHQ
ncbi:MAG: type II toxin-antitoxin system prevent-host-death family antitoxin [Pseudonocardiaceae bacterium]|nr:type II toxin-antitoxin system prevent-host-death family antitoxin [Pseudonocardiaceae bacterium]